MPQEDPYQVWLKEFRREMDKLMGSPSTPASAAAARNAKVAFDSWWRSEQEGWLEGKLPIRERLPKTGARVPAKPHDPLCDHRAERMREVEARLERTRASYESMLEKLRGQAALVEDHLRRLGQARDPQQTRQRLESSGKGLADEARLQGLEGELYDTRRRLKAAEEELRSLRQIAAASEQALTELRRQTSFCQDRLTKAEESAGNGMRDLRQDLLRLTDGLKRIMDAIGGKA
jgi:hypothetical protein